MTTTQRTSRRRYVLHDYDLVRYKGKRMGCGLLNPVMRAMRASGNPRASFIASMRMTSALMEDDYYEALDALADGLRVLREVTN